MSFFLFWIIPILIHPFFSLSNQAYKNSKIKEYGSFITILQNWHQEIINSFNIYDGRRISNGNLERKNADIKTLIRVSFGATNFKRTRNRIMFCSNKNAPIVYGILKVKSVGYWPSKM